MASFAARVIAIVDLLLGITVAALIMDSPPAKWMSGSVVQYPQNLAWQETALRLAGLGPSGCKTQPRSWDAVCGKRGLAEASLSRASMGIVGHFERFLNALFAA